MQKLLQERKVELQAEQYEATEVLLNELSKEHVDQAVVANLTQRIQRISGRITELESLQRYTKRREVK